MKAVVACVLLLAVAPATALADCGGVVASYPHGWHRTYRPPLVIGDSTMIFAAPLLAGRGFEADAHGCRQFSAGVAMLRARRHAHTLPRVAILALGANVLAVKKDSPARTVAELIALAKAGALSYASQGNGSTTHLTMELFKSRTGTQITHVPYKGAAPALQDVIAGHVQMMFATAASVIGLIKSGKVRALAVTTPQRTALLPDLPTVDELGIKGFDATTWHGLVAPTGTPREVIDTLHFAVTTALKDPATHKQLIELGVDIAGSTPKEFEAYIKSEIPKWTAVVKTSGAQIE